MPAWAKHLRDFGEAGTVKIRSKMQPKLDDRGVICMFMGYPDYHPEGTYYMLNPEKKSIMVTRDVIFLGRMYFPHEGSSTVDVVGAVQAREGIIDSFRLKVSTKLVLWTTTMNSRLHRLLHNRLCNLSIKPLYLPYKLLNLLNKLLSLQPLQMKRWMKMNKFKYLRVSDVWSDLRPISLIMWDWRVRKMSRTGHLRSKITTVKCMVWLNCLTILHTLPLLLMSRTMLLLTVGKK
jgi:hypothetical protein